MDEITKGWLNILSSRHPNKSIVLSHQFLDGTDLHECGYMPSNWDGTKVYYNVKENFDTLAQLIRALSCHARGHQFNSDTCRQINNRKTTCRN